MSQWVLALFMEWNNNFGSIVHTFLGNELDLVALEAVCHIISHVQSFNEVTKCEGKVRSKTKFLLNVTDQTCSWLENENQVFTLKDVELKLNKLAYGEPVCEVKCIKQKFEKNFKVKSLLVRYWDEET